MSKYKDDLEAAQERIRALENQVAELKGEHAQAVAAPPNVAEAPPVKKVTKANKTGCALSGVTVVVLIFLLVSCSTRACIACDSEVTDPALAAVNKCDAVRAELGDDIGWSMMGCSNYRSRSGGDPLNGGCHSSASYSVPISGSKGRGTYSFSSSSPPGKPNKFNGGWVWVPSGKNISINADGTCK